MKLGKFLFTGSLSLFALAACVSNDDKSEWNDGSQPISFTSSIQGLNTRAANAEWTAGDKVGIFMKAAGGDLSAATAVNKLHTTDKNGNLTAFNADNALYYPTEGGSVDFVAYYPYVASLTGTTYKVDVTTQTDQPAIDLLYSDNAKGFAKNAAGKPQLQFAHMLSQIVFNVEKDATIPTLNGLKVTFKGMNTKADFALADGKLSNAGNVADIASNVDVNSATATTIVLPATALSDIKVVFDLNGKSYTADYPQNALDAGRKYVHKVILSDRNGQPVIVMEAATITDWIEVSGGDINVDFGDGGVTPPDPTDVVILDESFNTGKGLFTIEDKNLGGMNFVWNYGTHEGKGYMKASGWYNNNANACESWLVSPDIDLSKAKKATLTFMHCDNNSKADLAARQAVMTLWATEAATENWEQITIPTYGVGNAYTYVASGDIDLSKYAGKSMKFAFKYVCNGDFSATWQIQDVKVIADAGEGGGTVDPDPTPGTETIILTETLGAAVSSTTKITAFTGWDNKELTFTGDADGNADIRAIAHKTEANPTESQKVNNLWLKPTKNSSLSIGTINAEGYKNIKVLFEAAANVFNTGDEIDLNTIVVKWNGTSMTVPSKVVSKANSQTNIFFEMTVTSNLEGTSNSVLEFSAPAETNKYGLRVTNIRLLGTK